MSIQTHNLIDIATVKTFLTFRDQAPTYSDNGNAFGITTKDLVSNWAEFDNLATIEINESMTQKDLQTGDILMPSRGDYYPARLFKKKNIPSFPIGQINVITLQKEIVPGYLAWYLNRPEIQNLIFQSLNGTTIKSLNKSRLNSLPISVPDHNTQIDIVRVQEIYVEKAKIRLELNMLEKKEIDYFCNCLITK